METLIKRTFEVVHEIGEKFYVRGNTYLKNDNYKKFKRIMERRLFSGNELECRNFVQKQI